MTGPEREDFRAMREEIREGFAEVRADLEKVIERTSSLELSRATWEGERRATSRIKSDARWRLGLILGVATSLFIGAVNLVVNLTIAK